MAKKKKEKEYLDIDLLAQDAAGEIEEKEIKDYSEVSNVSDSEFVEIDLSLIGSPVGGKEKLKELKRWVMESGGESFVSYDMIRIRFKKKKKEVVEERGFRICLSERLSFNEFGKKEEEDDSPVPKVGQEIYVGNSDNFKGGLAKVTRVTQGRSGGEEIYFITVEEHPGKEYNWEQYLKKDQKILKILYGRQRACKI